MSYRLSSIVYLEYLEYLEYLGYLGYLGYLEYLELCARAMLFVLKRTKDWLVNIWGDSPPRARGLLKGNVRKLDWLLDENLGG